MNKLYASILVLLLPAMAHTQITIQLQVPPLGLTIKPQLWNISLVNASNNTYTAKINMVMTDVSNNQQVLSGTSNSFPFIPGAKQLQAKDLTPVTYNSNGAIAIDPSPDGFLPTGVYNICYTLLGSGKDGIDITLAEVCETFEIEPLSPPQLISPANQEEVTIPRPTFSWLPPAPVSSFSRLLYDMIIVEVQPTQSSADAIQLNPPVLSRQRIDLTNLQYPQSAPALDTGKVYAWRISARNNQVLTAHSEIATFTISKEKADNVPDLKAMYFAKLQPAEDASFAVCTGVLRFEYNNLYNQQQLHYRLFSLSNNKRTELSRGDQQYALRYGQNYLELNLQPISGMVNKQFYLLEVSGSGNEKWYLKFEYRKP